MTVKTAPLSIKGLNFSTSYLQLPTHFYQQQRPSPVTKPSLIHMNHALAKELGIDSQSLAGPDGIDILAGNKVPQGAASIALAYAGHQFGHFNPQLGDGRAILLGELKDAEGKHWDIQLKGAGPTPYSRNGDGRSAMGPVLREYVLSEAMHRLGIKTTRALAAVASGEQVYREQALPGAIFTRVASSHIRVGTFEYFYGKNQPEAIKQLADYVIQRHYPELQDAEKPYLALLAAVIDAQAQLIASWMSIGFVHGVMNTDNTSIYGETIDYGPCAFMENYDPATCFSSIDQQKRYAYGNQPAIGQWNMARLAESLLSLLDSDQKQAVKLAEELLSQYPERFNQYWLALMRKKTGLTTAAEGDEALIKDFLAIMNAEKTDFTLGFRNLSNLLANTEGVPPASSEKLQNWLQRWQQRLAEESRSKAEVIEDLNKHNPLYIPRNHLVEAMIEAAVKEQNFGPMEDLIAVLREPYTEQTGKHAFATAGGNRWQQYRTFCGT